MSEGEQTQIMTRKDLEAKIIAKAWSDEEFHQKFLEDPKKQFEEHLGTKLPEDLVMTALQEDNNHLYFVIPAKPLEDLDELSDDDLEKIAGGVGVSAIVSVAASVSLSIASIAIGITTGVSIGAAETAAISFVTRAAGWGQR